MKKKYAVGVTFGALDLCHAGHVLLLEDMAGISGWRVVGLHADPSTERAEKNSPIMSVSERKILLRGSRFVDEIIVYRKESDIPKILKRLVKKYGAGNVVRVRGSDHKGHAAAGEGLVPIHYHKRDHDWSTTNLRKRIYEAEKNRLAKAKRTRR